MSKPKLPKFTLTKNEDRARWQLERDKSHQVVRSWKTKDEATVGGALKKAVGPDGGSVKIQKEDGKFQEERTFPRSKDPRKSKG